MKPILFALTAAISAVGSGCTITIQPLPLTGEYESRSAGSPPPQMERNQPRRWQRFGDLNPPQRQQRYERFGDSASADLSVRPRHSSPFQQQPVAWGQDGPRYRGKQRREQPFNVSRQSQADYRPPRQEHQTPAGDFFAGMSDQQVADRIARDMGIAPKQIFRDCRPHPELPGNAGGWAYFGQGKVGLCVDQNTAFKHYTIAFELARHKGWESGIEDIPANTEYADIRAIQYFENLGYLDPVKQKAGQRLKGGTIGYDKGIQWARRALQ